MRWPDGPVVGYSLSPDTLVQAAEGSSGQLAHLGPHDDDATSPLSERPGLVEALVQVKVTGARCLLVGQAADLGGGLHWSAVAQVAESLGARLLSAAADGPNDEAELESGTVGDAKLMMAEHRRLAHAVDVRIGHREKGAKRKSRHPPYGYAFGEEGDLVEVAEEAATVKRIQELHGEGRSLREISAVLQREGRLARSGRPLATSTLHSVLKRCS